MKDPAVKRMKHRKRIKNLSRNQSPRGCCEGWESPAAPRRTPSTPLPPGEDQALGLLTPHISEKLSNLASRSVQPNWEELVSGPKAQAVSLGCITRWGKARAETGKKLGSLCWDSSESSALHGGPGELLGKSSPWKESHRRNEGQVWILFCILSLKNSSVF